MPSRVILRLTSHPVVEYFRIPLQCFRCQRHGHIPRHCHGQQRCKLCAGPHRYKECMNKTNPTRANCGGSHCASFSGGSHKNPAMTAIVVNTNDGESMQPELHHGVRSVLSPTLFSIAIALLPIKLMSPCPFMRTIFVLGSLDRHQIL